VSPASIEQNLSAILKDLKSRNVRLIVCGRAGRGSGARSV
jgi:hypothetical protein